jgi:2-polyprenyl-3-methyl-5-hydroxy-6-metoxy-1,4-benzoquinol methylase
MSAVVESINPEIVEQKAGMVFGFLSGAVVAGMIWLGDELGLYRSMRGAGPLSSQSFATRTGLNERWVREWLMGQAGAGLLDYSDGKFELSAEAALVLADEENPASAIGGFAEFPRQWGELAKLPHAFRTGRGFTYDEGGEAVAHSVERMFGPWHKTMLTTTALPAIAGVVAKLDAGAKVADVGCGAAIADVVIAKAFPKSEVHGYDTSKFALARAHSNVAEAELHNVKLHNPDAGDALPDSPTFDLVLCLDCLHDMARPDLVASAIRKAIKPDGAWFIVDIECKDFEGNLENPLAGMMYGFSLMTCMSSSASTPDGLALGTVGLPEPKMRDLVLNAGFRSFERVPGLEHPFNAYYVARP